MQETIAMLESDNWFSLPVFELPGIGHPMDLVSLAEHVSWGLYEVESRKMLLSRIWDLLQRDNLCPYPSLLTAISERRAAARDSLARWSVE
jgi:hypothetical protein